MSSSDTIKPGAKVAGYSVMAEIGRGAASVIYLVQDAKTRQIWALKHVEKHSAKDQRFLDQAENEAEVSSKLDSPNIRRVERVIKNRSLLNVKELFLVMEYIDGISIEKRPPTSVDDSLDIFRQVARALAHMHSRGLVHADMKPNNIVVTEDGTVKIIDLGQSCPVGTVKERIQGTPDYIAPEQVHLRAIMPQTDVYNLGASMYWVLTGRHIPTAIPKGDSLVSTLDDALIEKPVPIKELRPLLPDQLCELIMQSVEVDPANRPPSMDAVADKLDLLYAKITAGRRLKERAAAGELPDDDDTRPIRFSSGPRA